MLMGLSSVTHEIRREAGEYIQNAGQGAMHRTDAKLVADALDLQLNIGSLKRQFRRYANRLGISIFESFSGVHVINLVCTWMYHILGFPNCTSSVCT
ncbi:hypothetical protein CUJ84_pRLN3000171 (plasmid) [Rhizobium leguminosarum]|uniref:Uncharacterized protein n=1 Tax=Rhizobium leguminosarum TaxID=384 RepID=A0A2K9ZGB6_RHILE|nr:hypothetical protein CUJ84_pRLN3000171 [Rhizobium leguminosarum]